MEKLRVLVTGGAGFIGSHTVDQIVERGHSVRILDAMMPPVHVQATIPSYLPADVEVIHGDVRDRAAWERALEGIDAVFHLAAYQDYLLDFSNFFHTNTVGTALLYEVLVQRRLAVRKVILASSQAVYGEGKYRCPASPLGEASNEVARSQDGHSQVTCYPPPRPDSQLRRGEWDVTCPSCGTAMEPVCTDEEYVNPHNQYAISKYTQEMLALSLGRRYDIPTVCMRYSIVQGSRQSFRNAYSGVLRIFTQRLLNSKPPVCYEDGHQLRDYVSVHDVARANLLVLESDAANYQCFNVGGNRRMSVLEYAGLIARRAGVAIEPVIPGIYRYGDTRHIFSDTSKLGCLGWRPLVSMESVVDEYIAWVSTQPGFDDYSGEAEARMAAVGAIRTVSA
jgi:dTDP-L-rhamnose 4-epimerase